MYKFESPLEIGEIISRPNRFIMNVKKGKSTVLCHCPSTGKIGNIVLDGLPCLLHRSSSLKRKTASTVEAISVDGAKSWVGINQTAVNKYVEHFFRKGLLSEIVGGGNDILREQKIGNSRLDFRIHNTYVEVKMPLMYLPCAVSDAPIPERNVSNFERFVRHVGDLSNSLSANKKAILLLCFIYDAPVFQAPKPNKKNETIRNAVYKSLRSGVQMWQLNMGIAPQGVNLLKYFDITPLFL